ncbi:MAG: T9SS type A sorting domain-containing protein [Bacteroidales bacterium]|nr:T9SS type A sorting domain-containing protein [Bacteroidales bacterium]
MGEESTLTVVAAEETSYYVYVEDAVSSATDTVTLNPEPSPEFTLGADTALCINHKLELSIPEGFASYEWQDGSTSNTFMGRQHQVPALGENFIIATVEGDNGCSTTDTLKVIMETCAGIADNPLSQSRIYPNPVKEELYIELNSSGNVHISITDVNGKEVYKSNAASGHQRTKHTVNVAPWREGVYFIIMRNDEYETVKKFIKSN